MPGSDLTGHSLVDDTIACKQDAGGIFIGTLCQEAVRFGTAYRKAPLSPSYGSVTDPALSGAFPKRMKMVYPLHRLPKGSWREEHVPIPRMGLMTLVSSLSAPHPMSASHRRGRARVGSYGVASSGDASRCQFSVSRQAATAPAAPIPAITVAGVITLAAAPART